MPLYDLEASSSRFWFEVWPMYERGVTEYWAYVSSETESCVTVQTEGNMTVGHLALACEVAKATLSRPLSVYLYLILYCFRSTTVSG